METQTSNGRGRFSVGYFFLCLGVLITLITTVVSFLNLVFETLNKRFPDVLNATYQYGYSTWEYENIRMFLATLIIVFPVFVAVSYYWRKFEKGGLGYFDEIFKRWLIYIVLFLSSAVVIIDLVTLVKYFISGEITSRFILKVLTALVVSALVGTYYIFMLRGKDESKPKVAFIFRIVSILLVIGAVVWSFTVIGSPKEQRQLRLDEQRTGDLQNIQWQVISYWQRKNKLPANLTDIVDPISGWSLPVDPEFENGKQYEYRALAPKKFELCATFALPMPEGWREYGGVQPMPYYDKAVSYPYPGGVNESWDHEAGRTCFERTIDPELYPPYPEDRNAY